MPACATSTTQERLNHGEDHDPETHLIPMVLDAALGRQPSISIFGTDYPTRDGTCIRDFIHVSDIAAAHLLALDRLGRDESPERLIYSLGNGRRSSVREVIEAARHVTGRTITAVDAPRRPGDPAVLMASSEKIKRDLKWSPKHPDLESMIHSAWRWRLVHPHGYRKAVAK